MSLSFTGYQTRSTRYQGELESDPEDVLGATAAQALSESPIVSLFRINELSSAEGSPDRLTAESARAKLKDAGLDGQLKVPDTGIAAPALDILMERKRDEMRRNEIIGRAPEGFVMGARRLGMSFAASAIDPINAGLSFVPVVGEARYMRYLAGARGIIGRTAVRAGVGAAEGAVGAAIAEPLIYAAKTQEQADYDFQDSLLNVAFGTVLGGGLHVVGGAGADAVRAVRERGARPELMDAHVAARIEAMSMPDREAAMRTAVGQAMQGKAVDVDAVIPRGAMVPAEENLLRQQIDTAITAREQQLTAVTTGKGAPFADSADIPNVINDLTRATEMRDRLAAEVSAASPEARPALIERQREAQALVDSRKAAVDRVNQVRSAEGDLEQLRYQRNSAKTIDDLVDVLPQEQQAGFRRRIEQGRKEGYVRQLGAELPAVIERQASPAADVTADVRASEAADAQLTEKAQPAQKSSPAQAKAEEPAIASSDEIAEQEALLATETQALDEEARVAGIEDIDEELADLDSGIKLAEEYGIALRAAALCGVAH
jgi:hypothetical protein